MYTPLQSPASPPPAYLLGDGKSEWGARDGETLRLRRLLSDELTQTTVTVENAAIDRAEEWDGVSLLQFNEFPCPDCNELSIVQKFDAQYPCPACNNGHINESGSCIY